MDGARIWNAAAALGLPFAAFTRDAGVDVLSLGGTKNGLLGAEAIVVLDPDRVDGLVFLRKLNMQLASKMRFASAQLLALFEDGLGIRTATHANAMAARLRAGLEEHRGRRLQPPDAGERDLRGARPRRRATGSASATASTTGTARTGRSAGCARSTRRRRTWTTSSRPCGPPCTPELHRYGDPAVRSAPDLRIVTEAPPARLGADRARRGDHGPVMGVNHATSGAAVWFAATAALPSFGTHAYPLAAAGVLSGALVCAGAALLPDADHHSGTIAHSVPVVGKLVARSIEDASGGHRHGFHTILAGALVTLLAVLVGRFTDGPAGARRRADRPGDRDDRR